MNERLVEAVSVRLGDRERSRLASGKRHQRRMACVQFLSLLIAICLCGALATISSAAVRNRKADVHMSVVASSQGVVAHIRGVARSRCTLTVAAGAESTTLAPITLNKSGRGIVSWPVPESAPSGKWTFSVLCVKQRHATRTRTAITLVNHGGGTGGLVQHLGEGGGKGGSGQSCAPIAVPPGGGQVCFSGDPFATYGPHPGEDIGQCTWYAAGRRPDLDGITTGNASEWLAEAQGKVPEGIVPVAGAIAVNKTADGGVGHVAYIDEVKNGGATLVLDEANLKNDEKVYLDIETPASEFVGYIYGGPAGNGPSSTPTPAPAPTPTPAPTPAPPITSSQTTGPGPVHTWTNYTNAGGTEGPSIPDNSTVQIACRVQGLAVEDGNTWWYRIAQSPWEGNYYASADAFYNNGSTSGSLKGTPFVDEAVPQC
jgi:surface antigen